MMRVMALDVGEARIGVALSDASRMLASPYTTLFVSGDETQLWAAIQRLIAEEEAGELVVGLPISLDGQIHAQAVRTQEFAERLKAQITIPLLFWDERLSTVEAQRLLNERQQDAGGKRSRQGGRKRGQRKRRNRQGIDALAATVILQEYLDHLHRKTED